MSVGIFTHYGETTMIEIDKDKFDFIDVGGTYCLVVKKDRTTKDQKKIDKNIKELKGFIKKKESDLK